MNIPFMDFVISINTRTRPSNLPHLPSLSPRALIENDGESLIFFSLHLQTFGYIYVSILCYQEISAAKIVVD